jgi:hypothetical protein
MKTNRLASTLVLMLLFAGTGMVAREARAQSGPFQYFAVTPCRVADTRSASFNVGAFLNGTPKLGGTVRGFFVKGMCGIPGTAKAVSVNVTVVNPPGGGWLALYPGGTTWSGISTLNYPPGLGATANGAIVPISSCTSPCGDLNVYSPITGTMDVVLDLTGYFQ